MFNVGNTTFGSSPGGGTLWCIDHLQGVVYSKVIDEVGAMYYEVDGQATKGDAPQCRFLAGFDGIDGSGNKVYHARTYDLAGLSCVLTQEPSVDGVQSYDLAVSRPGTVRETVPSSS